MASSHPILRLSDRAEVKTKLRKTRGTRYCNLGNLRVITGSPQFVKPEIIENPQLDKLEEKTLAVEIPKSDSPQVPISKKVLSNPDPSEEIPSILNDYYASSNSSQNSRKKRKRRRRYRERDRIYSDSVQFVDSRSNQMLHEKDYAFGMKSDLYPKNKSYSGNKYSWYNKKYKYPYSKQDMENLDDVSDVPLEEDLEEVEVASDSDDPQKSDVLVGYRRCKPSYLKHRVLGHFKPKVFILNKERAFIKCASVNKLETEVELSEVENEEAVSEVEFEEIAADGNVSDEFLNENMVIIDDAEEELENVNSEPIDSEPSKSQLIENDVTVSAENSESSMISVTIDLHQEKAIFQDSLDNWNGHLIGLEYIVEIWNKPGGKVVNYYCFICNNSISLPEPFISNVFLADHVDTINHISLYLAKHFPTCGYKLTDGTPNVGSDELRYCVKELESKFARESIFVTNHDYFQSNLTNIKIILDDSPHWTEDEFMLDIAKFVPVQKDSENRDDLKTTDVNDSSSIVGDEAVDEKEESKCIDASAAEENTCIGSETVDMKEMTKSVVDSLVEIVSTEIEGSKPEGSSPEISEIKVIKEQKKGVRTKLSSLQLLRKHSKLSPKKPFVYKKQISKKQIVKSVKPAACDPVTKPNLTASFQPPNPEDSLKISCQNVVSDEVILHDVKPHLKPELKDQKQFKFLQRPRLPHSKYCLKRLYRKTNSKAADIVHDQADSEVDSVTVSKLASSSKECKESTSLGKIKTPQKNLGGVLDTTRIVLKKTSDKKNVAHPHKHLLKEYSDCNHSKIAHGEIKQSKVLDEGVHESLSKSSGKLKIANPSIKLSTTKHPQSRSPERYSHASPNSKQSLRSYQKISRSQFPHSKSSSHDLPKNLAHDSKNSKRKVVSKHDELSIINKEQSGRIVVSPLPEGSISATIRDAKNSKEQITSKQSKSPKEVLLETGGSSKTHVEKHFQDAPEIWFEKISEKNVDSWKKSSRSPNRHHSRSPIDKYSKKYMHYSKSPIRKISKSPLRKYSRSPPRKYFKSPIRRYEKSPIRRYSRSPIRRHSRSPFRRQSRSPLKRHSRSPIRRRSRSPLRRYSRSPIRRHSRSPIRRHSRSPNRGRPRSPIRRHQRSPLKGMSRSPTRKYTKSPNRRHSRSPHHWSNRSPVRRHSKSPFRRYSRSPVDSTSISSFERHVASLRRRVKSPTSSYSRNTGHNLSKSPSRKFSSPEKTLLINRNYSRSPDVHLDEKYSRQLSHKIKSSDERRVSYSKLTRHVKQKDDFPLDDLDSISDEDESFYFSTKDKISGTTEFKKLPYTSKMLIVSILQGLSLDELDPNDPAVQRMVQFFNSNKAELQQFINQNAPVSGGSNVNTHQIQPNRDFQHQQIPPNPGRSFPMLPTDVNFNQPIHNAPPATFSQDFSFPINFPPPQKGPVPFVGPVAHQRFPFPIENPQPWPPHHVPPMQHPMQPPQPQMMPNQPQMPSHQFQMPPTQFQMPPPQIQTAPDMMMGKKHELHPPQPTREELAARQQQMAQDQLNSFFHGSTSNPSSNTSIPTDVVFKDLRATVSKLFGDKKSNEKKETSSDNSGMNQSRHGAKSPTDFDYRHLKSTNIDSGDPVSDHVRLREEKSLSFPPPDAKVSFCDAPRFGHQRNLFPVVSEASSMKGSFLPRKSSSGGVSNTKISLAQRLASVLISVGMVDVPAHLLQEMLMKIGAYSSCPPQDINETDIIYILRKCGYMR